MLKPVETREDHWFFGPILACKSVYVQVIFASVLINLFALASSLYIMTVYDRVVPNNAIHSLWWLTGMIAVVILSDLAMKILRGIFVDTASARVDKQVSAALVERIARHDATLSRNATGSLASTVRNFDILKDVIGSASFTVFADLPFILLFLFVLYAIGGPVAAVHVKTIGAVVQAGTVLVDIVPAESVLQARAQVLPQHVAAVRPGQIARLSVSAYDPSRYGVLMGVVQRVATNTTQPENQMPYYETIIEIPEVRLTKSGIQPEIAPGMPLTVDILGDKRTVMNYIITPIEKSWKSAFREQ